LADYREHYPEIRSAGACLAAVSVDLRESSEALRTQLSLPFPILCDTERRVVKDWDIYNSGERGGIAKPAVFVIDPDQVVRYSSVDSVATRVPAVEIVHLLQSAANEQPIRRTPASRPQLKFTCRKFRRACARRLTHGRGRFSANARKNCINWRARFLITESPVLSNLRTQRFQTVPSSVSGYLHMAENNGSSGRTRTYNPPVNSRMLCH
jgi:hypothetical protein